RPDTSEYLDASGEWLRQPAWALTATDGALSAGGLAGLNRPAQYAGTLFFDDFSLVRPTELAPAPGAAARQTASGPPVKPLPRPTIPRHYPHIRIAMLAYSGNPMGAFEDNLLRNSVDLVVPNDRYMKHIAAVAPKTLQITYTNTSNLYLHLLTD